MGINESYPIIIPIWQERNYEIVEISFIYYKFGDFPFFFFFKLEIWGFHKININYKLNADNHIKIFQQNIHVNFWFTYNKSKFSFQVPEKKKLQFYFIELTIIIDKIQLQQLSGRLISHNQSLIHDRKNKTYD